ncbi:MAG: cytochrome c-type biogenesis protein CcmH [Polyangiaceae bacterium]|nr:cytochrome c-type biogenesis protein CcmH [Polyangiaceae bacterium]
MLRPDAPMRPARRPSRLAAAAGLAVVLAATLPAAAQPEAGPRAAAVPPDAAPPPGERALLGRLVAPCCWSQTLDIHESPTVDALRAEIRRRLLAGEAPEAIEADLVARHGERMRALQPGSSLGSVALGVAGLSLAAGAALLALVRRWASRRAAPAGSPAPDAAPAAGDAWEARLDEAQRALD